MASVWGELFVHVDTRSPQPSRDRIRRLIREQLQPHFPVLARCHSIRELRAHPLYPAIEPIVDQVLTSIEVEHFGPTGLPPRLQYRFLAWNLERGLRLDGQIEAFRTHEYLRSADVVLLTETDVGMARTGNRDVARTLARELGLHYAFVPCYLNLTKGAGVEHAAEGENELGLHGNALLSRYPIGRVRLIRLENGTDKMAGREKRLGSQAALAAEIEFPNLRLTAVTVHLDAHSSQRHRRKQMETVLDALPPEAPTVIGGDWNTTTFNSSTAFRAIMGYWLRVLMGPGNVIRNHYLQPDRRFERGLFQLLERRGFDYRRANLPGEPTMYYRVDDERTYQGLAEWVPGWCFPFIRWALRHYDGGCPLKLDWFATRDVRIANPAVIHDLHGAGGTPLSDHDAIGLDILA